MNNHTESTVFYLKVKNLLFKIIFLNKSYLKLDVEGAELQAMPQWLEVCKEKILQGIINPVYRVQKLQSSQKFELSALNSVVGKTVKL